MELKIIIASAVSADGKALGPDVQIRQTISTIGSDVEIRIGDAVAKIDASDLQAAANRLKT